MIFTNFSLHCKGPIFRGRLCAAHTVVLKSSAPPAFQAWNQSLVDLWYRELLIKYILGYLIKGGMEKISKVLTSGGLE